MRRLPWILLLLFGLVLAGLRGLWALQGADLIHLDPVPCVADCEPLTGFSGKWLGIGLAAVAIGLFCIGSSVRKMRSVDRSSA